MFWRHAREMRERLERLESALLEERRSSTDQQAALASLAKQMAALAKTLSAVGDRLEGQIADVRSSLAQPAPELTAALRGVEQSTARSARSGKRLAKGVGKLGTQLKRIQARLSRVGGTFEPDSDARFLEVADPLRESRRTMLGYDRLFTLWQAARNVAPLGLPAVEIGTFRGGSAALVAEAFRTAGAAPDIHVVDTFAGHLDHTFTGHDVEAQRGKFRGTSYEDVREFLSPYPGVQVHQGDAAAVVRDWPERIYSLVHIDVDLYGPTRDCLEYFGARLNSGGVIVVDDFDSPTCPGVRAAVEEFLPEHPGFQIWKLQAEQIVLVLTGRGAD